MFSGSLGPLCSSEQERRCGQRLSDARWWGRKWGLYSFEKFNLEMSVFICSTELDCGQKNQVIFPFFFFLPKNRQALWHSLEAEIGQLNWETWRKTINREPWLLCTKRYSSRWQRCSCVKMCPGPSGYSTRGRMHLSWEHHRVWAKATPRYLLNRNKAPCTPKRAYKNIQGSVTHQSVDKI